MKKELYWDMFRALLAIMSSRTKLTAVDAMGPASGGICISGVVQAGTSQRAPKKATDYGDVRVTVAVTIEEVEE